MSSENFHLASDVSISKMKYIYGSIYSTPCMFYYLVLGHSTSP